MKVNKLLVYISINLLLDSLYIWMKQLKKCRLFGEIPVKAYTNMQYQNDLLKGKCR
jgi:hypothetical protein